MKKLFIILLISPICSLAQHEVEANYLQSNATGGTLPYRYSIDNITYQDQDTFKCLAPGVYKYYTKDFYNNIIVDSFKLYIPLTANIIALTTTSITITGIAGKPNYMYKLSTSNAYKNNGIFINLRKNKTYTFYIKDSLGYIVLITITL